MRFTFTESQEALRREVADFFAEAWSAEEQRRAAAAGEIELEHSPGLIERLAEKGWLALNWPKEYGGGGWGPMERGIYHEEAGFYRVPLGVSNLTAIVGSAIIGLGSEAQKKYFLPRMAAGKLFCCIGYTEPNAGSDLASLECRAERVGDHYLVNGTKMFNSGGRVADYCWLASRTRTNVPKHKGISIFLVDMKSPGISVRPLWNVSGHCAQNELVFQEVRVPADNLVGGENNGWHVINHALAIERNFTSQLGGHRRDIEELSEFCRTTIRNGAPLSQDPVVRQQLAGLLIEAEVARLLTYQVVCLQEKGETPAVLAAMSKLFGSELHQRIAHTSVQIMGLRGLIPGSSQWTVAAGAAEHHVRSSISVTIAGGSSEVMRQIIALRGLGLPR